jgi:site-specific recombinase XerD
MSVSQLDSVLEACDLSTVSGRRDLAVLLLLSRLGLRASEVACLSLDDIDWRAGLLRVHGKGGRVATMPLPKDVGAAISDYISAWTPDVGLAHDLSPGADAMYALQRRRRRSV